MTGLPTARSAVPYFIVAVLTAGLAWLSFATSWWEVPYPARYQTNDDIIYLAFAKNFTETWSMYTYERLAAPFHFDAVDFPFFTFTNFAVIAVIDAFVDNIQQSVFFFLILHIGASAAVTMGVCRMMSLGYVPSALGGLAFGLTPYTLTRNVAHMDYAVGITFPLLLMLIIAAAKADAGQPVRHRLLLALAFLFGAFTVVQQFYYAFYVVIFIAVLWLFWYLPRRSKWGLGVSAAIGAGIVVSALVFILGFQWSEYAEVGRNLAYTRRSVASTTNLSLVLSYLVLPQEFHRITSLAHVKQTLNTAMITSTVPYFDIWTHSLGVFGTVGFGYLALRLLSPWRVAKPFPMSTSGEIELRTMMLGMLGTMVLAAILYGVPGGGAALIAQYVSPQFHGVHRIALPIACFSAVATAILLQSLSERFEAGRSEGIPRRRFGTVSRMGLVVFIAGAALIYGDQTVDYSGPNWFAPFNQTAPSRIRADHEYFNKVEAAVKPGDGVYVYPTLPWSGVAPEVTTALKPMINTNTIRWSAAPPWFRQTSNWSTELARLDFGAATKRLTDKGFAGVLLINTTYEAARKHPYWPYPLDLAGMAAALEKLSPAPPIVSEDGVFRFYLLPGHETASLKRDCEIYDLGTPLGFKSTDFNFRYFDLGWAQPVTIGTYMARAYGYPPYVVDCH